MAHCTRTVAHESTEHHDLGCTDAKGRAIGAFIRRDQVTFALADDTVVCPYIAEPGHHFSFTPHLTKNGREFGPVQYHKYFRTAEAREAGIAKYLADARKRHTK